jgi:hypothetical protein
MVARIAGSNHCAALRSTHLQLGRKYAEALDLKVLDEW